MLKPYNGTLFDLRKSYPVVFRELASEDAEQKAATKDIPSNQVLGESSKPECEHAAAEAEKFYKISYSVNLLA